MQNREHYKLQKYISPAIQSKFKKIGLDSWDEYRFNIDSFCKYSYFHSDGPS